MEFHIGICITRVLDFVIEADSREAAEEKFTQMSKDGKLNTLPQAQLDLNIEVLGMLEGPLPVMSGDEVEHAVPAAGTLH